MRKAAPMGLAETELYAPVRDYLLKQGYKVRSEVRHCDIAATKGDDLIVIELKKTFSTALLVQAAKRQRVTDSVYVALPRPKSTRTWNAIRYLLRRLELGLIAVSLNGKTPAVRVAFHPIPYHRQKRARAKRAVLREIADRSGDFNEGGSNRRKLVTAYRENAIHIASCLSLLGPLKPAQLRELGTGPKTLSVLYRNVYGWFERVDRGLYALRAQGQAELAEYPQLVRRYRRLIRKKSKLSRQTETG